LTNNAKEALEGFTKSYQTRRPWEGISFDQVDMTKYDCLL
jgi:hypothetical protein